MAIETNEGGTVITGPHIKYFQMKAQLSALGLEIKGMKHSKGSVYAHIKRFYGFKGNKQAVYDQYAQYIEQWKERPVCITCGSDEVKRDAWAEWSIEKQDWVLVEIFDECFCPQCEQSTWTLPFNQWEQKNAKTGSNSN